MREQHAVRRLSRNERSLSTLLGLAAEEWGERPCLRVSGRSFTYAQVVSEAARAAGTLREAGVQPGDRVAVMAENRWEILRLLLGCAWSGAVLVPVNAAARGLGLAHILSDSAPRVLAVESGLEAFVADAPLPPDLERIWLLGAAGAGSLRGPRVETLPGDGQSVDPAPPGPGDPLAILYTSGTTGRSKGVVCPHAQFTWWGENVAGWLQLESGDVLYTCLPLYHTNALNSFVQAVVSGAEYVVGPRFSASRFWERIVEADATVTYLLGTMVSILLGREPTPLDRAHRVRVALAPATSAEGWQAFEERFGVRLVNGHGMTETNATIGPRDGIQRPGWMGRVMPGFEARVVGDDGLDVPDGSAGELLLRSDEPLAFATGYWRLPEETAAVWDQGWFHTGDRVVRDSEGFLRFLDRSKDAIRRRGENISSWEVEQVLQLHPGVETAAVVPVPSELGEDDVMAYLLPRRGATVDPAELTRFCEPLLARFAIPRYVEIVEALPLTENGKVRKVELRARGVGPATWDREAAGVHPGTHVATGGGRDADVQG
jgi:carnitine-CoA ligase